MLFRGVSIGCVLLSAIAMSSQAAQEKPLVLVRDGVAQATIVVPANTLKVEQFAAQELQYHIKKATGATLPISTEGNTMPERAQIIIGASLAAKLAGLDGQKQAPNGFVIKRLGNTLLMVGHDSTGDITSPYSLTQDCWTRMGSLFAVYEFCEKRLNALWLWPGDLGTVVPQRKSLQIGTWSQNWNPPLVHTRLRDAGPYHGSSNAWRTAEVGIDFRRQQSIWQRRNRVAMGVNMDIHHAFTSWWNELGATRPELFAQLPDSTRRPDPSYYSAPELTAMCVSNPQLTQEIITRWKANRATEGANVDVSENDTPGKCCCPNCLAWDVPDPEHPELFADRVERAKKAFTAQSKADWMGWSTELGSVSDRYARFYMTVLAEAQKVDPEACVMGFAYANYWKPPYKTKLDPHVIIGIVPNHMFPWTKEDSTDFRKQWDGWAQTGCRLMLRPNYTLEGQGMPINYARQMTDEFNYAAERGLVATDFDSLIGQYSAQGINMYALARLQNNPKMRYDAIIKEYCHAFGPASTQVKRYLDYLEQVSLNLDVKAYKKACADTGGDWARFNRVARVIFTPEIMSKAQAMMDDIMKAAASDALALQRAQFLQIGLQQADLALKAQDAFESYKKTNDILPFGKALNALDASRAKVDNQYVASMGYLVWSESETWPRQFARLHYGEMLPLADTWAFAWDQDRTGDTKGYSNETLDTTGWLKMRVDAPWDDQPEGKKWVDDHQGVAYTGLGWYRTELVAPAKQSGTKAALIFGAVDEACTIWLNGKLLIDRPYPYQGNTMSWQEAFEVDVTDNLRWGQSNSLSVKVVNTTGKGGICKPVWLRITK